jgi:DNA-binding MarR family transcriptional regulator
MDQRSAAGAWTGRVLALIAAEPGRRAADLAERLGWETAFFKTRVRRLRALGLTESLEVGYRLSPRGQWLLAPLKR